MGASPPRAHFGCVGVDLCVCPVVKPFVHRVGVGLSAILLARIPIRFVEPWRAAALPHPYPVRCGVPLPSLAHPPCGTGWRTVRYPTVVGALHATPLQCISVPRIIHRYSSFPSEESMALCFKTPYQIPPRSKVKGETKSDKRLIIFY